MYQMTDAAFAEARRYCIRHHTVVEDGCLLTGLDSRVLPSRAIELTAAYLDRNVTAMLRLAATMAVAGTTQLPLSKARELVDGSPAPQSRSLLAVLEGESLVAIVERPAPTLGGEPTYSVRFTFERVGDHLIVEHLLSGIQDIGQAFAAGGRLHFLSESDASAGTNAGLLEALSIQLPETHGVELIDAVDGIAPILLQEPFIAGLQWRNPTCITDRTGELVWEVYGHRDTAAAAFEAILGLAPRPGHPLNATFLDRLLRPVPMLSRDPFWAHMLETSYSDWSDRVKQRSGVHRLIDTARRADLTALPDDAGTLWGMALAWFCASPDRRIRDRATMAVVSCSGPGPAFSCTSCADLLKAMMSTLPSGFLSPATELFCCVHPHRICMTRRARFMIAIFLRASRR
jgi:hypothetical protein